MVEADRHRFAALDSWRGVAALAVAFHHIGGTAFFFGTRFQANLSFSVDFFFVLSGFVIAASYGDRLAEGFSLLRYNVLRWGRVWPLHATMVLIYLALEVLLSVTGGFTGREPFTGPRDPAALPAVLLLLQAWIMPGRDLWNVQSWTISVEIGLYLGAALLWRGFGKLANWIGLALALVALAWLAGSPGLAAPVLRGVAGFGLGMACWAIWRRTERFHLGTRTCSVLELGLLGLLCWLLTGAPTHAAVDLLFAAMVLLFARQQGIVSRLLLTAPMLWLGAMSYALYMVHGLVIGRVFDLLAFAQARVGAQWVSSRLGGGDMLLLPPLPALAASLLMLGSSLAVAWLAWRFVEWPARAWSRRLAAQIPASGRYPAH